MESIMITPLQKSALGPLLVAATLGVSAGAAFGQVDAAPRTTSDAAAIRAVRPTHHPQYVAPTGKRKPPGRALDEREGMTPALEEDNARIKAHTLKSICKDAPGCEGGHLWKGRK